MGDLAISLAMKEQILLVGTGVSRERGTVLFRRGDPVAGIYLIRSGTISLVLEGANHSFPTRLLGAGSVVGLPATMAGSPYSLTAEVIQDAELTFVAREVLLECLRQQPALCFEVMELLSREISGTREAVKRR